MGRAGFVVGRGFEEEEVCAFAKPYEAIMKPRCFGAKLTEFGQRSAARAKDSKVFRDL